MLSGITVDLSSGNYSRYDQEVDTVVIHVGYTNSLVGDRVTASLIRKDGYGSVASVQSAPLAIGGGAGWVDLTIPLESCVDAVGLYRAKSGRYHVSVTDGVSTVLSDDFTITTVSANRIRNQLLKGVPLNTSETVAVLTQPQLVTGVTVTSVYAEHQADQFPLVYDANAQTLSWAGGVPVSLRGVRWNGTVVLPTKGTTAYIRVIVKPNLLPSVTTTEQLIVDRKYIEDQEFVDRIWEAENYIESKIWVPPEPVNGATPLIAAEYPGRFYDRILDTVHWQKPHDLMEFMYIPTPYVWIISLNELRGFLNTTPIIQVDSDWFDTSFRQGVITLVPRAGAALNWIWFGYFNFAMLMASQTIPNFWNYDITFGAKDLWGEAAVLREAIEKRAAVEILQRAGFDWKPGYTAESIARDGVSSSVAYARGPGGVFADLIVPYQDWLNREVERGRIRNRLVGLKFVTL